jgi:hypothetical protein
LIKLTVVQVVEATFGRVEAGRPRRPVRRKPVVDLTQWLGANAVERRWASTRASTSPASRKTRRCPPRDRLPQTDRAQLYPTVLHGGGQICVRIGGRETPA